jgi:cytokinesis protein
MEAAGLRNILSICENFGVPDITKQIETIQNMLVEDEAQLRERLDQEILGNFTDPQAVYDAIFARIQNTKAQDHFLSMMQHLLLIREEGLPMVHYYQFLDSLVTDVVMDKKLSGAEQRFGHSVERIIAQFNKSDRLQVVELEAAEARALAVRLKLEKESLESEVAQGEDGLVGNLKIQLVQTEEKLKNSRETASRIQNQLEVQKVDYEERINQLEAQIMELFRMLKEVGVGAILDRGTMDQKAFIETLERSFQRHRTISILEGRSRKKKIGPDGTVEDDDELEDPESTPGKTSLRSSRPPGSMGKRSLSKGTKQMGRTVDETGRVSQFMDAEEADAQEQIQQQMAAGAKMVSEVSFC